MSPRAPLVVVIADPNGAGKSTTAPNLLRGALAVDEFVNADTIARGLSALRPETAALAAGRVMLAHVKALAAARRDVALETTLVRRSFAPWLGGPRAQGHRSHLIFLSLPSPELALARVADRVRQGGHDVSEATVRRRFHAGLRNFLGRYHEVVDSWQMFDNAELSGPRLIAECRAGQAPEVLEAASWRNLQEKQR